MLKKCKHCKNSHKDKEEKRLCNKTRSERETGYQKYIRPMEWEMIKHWLKTRLTSPSSKMCIYTFAYLGLRINEAVPIKRHQFNNDFTIFRYSPLKKGKKNIIHEVSVPKRLSEMLVDYNRRWNKRYREGCMFFPWKNQSKNDHIRDSTIRYIFDRMRKELKLVDIYYVRPNGGGPLNRITPHTLRHYFAYNFCMAASKKMGDGMKATQERLAHTRIETTAKYINALKTSNMEAEIADLAADSM